MADNVESPFRKAPPGWGSRPATPAPRATAATPAAVAVAPESAGNPAFSVPVIARAIGLLILTWLTWKMVAGGLAYPRPSGVITIIDGANFIFHEAGHFIFMFFGEFLAVLGGSLNQVLIPAIFTGYFFWHRQRGSACATLFWTGQSLTGVAMYAADAQALRLPLHGSDGTDAAAIHDWHRLLKWTGLLDRAKTVGDLFFMVAVIMMVAALVVLALDLVRVYRHPPPLEFASA